MEREIFICACHSLEHQIVYWYDEEDKEIHVNIHLIQYGFLKRLWRGLRYAFGYRCRYGEWEDFIFKPEDVQKLREFIDKEVK